MGMECLITFRVVRWSENRETGIFLNGGVVTKR